jgi:hypothetical protein
MTQLLKGNFAVKKPVETGEAEEDLTSRFEREALKRLGGSIAFVSKKKFLYGVSHEPNRPDGSSTPAVAE